MAVKPNIPDVSRVEDPLIREALISIKRIIDTREGLVGEEPFVQKKNLQAGQQRWVSVFSNGQDFVKVAFQKPFTSVPKMVATAIKDDASSPSFSVMLRNITVSGFEFKLTNLTDTAHLSRDNFIMWMAFDDA